MIKEDRIQLNKRFCIAFSLLEDRGVIVKNDRSGKGIGDFAERVLGNKSYGHIVRAFLRSDSDRVISYSQARTFCREYGLNEAWMLDGMGSPFGMEVKDFQKKNNPGGRNNILFTSVEAFAGTAVDVGGFSREESEFFSLPGLSGEGLVAFPVQGNSMEPEIISGDVVVCREVNDFREIIDNEVYAVKTSGSVWVKYVQQIRDPQGNVGYLKLISANYLEHEPFEEEVNQYTRLYKVVRKISGI